MRNEERDTMNNEMTALIENIKEDYLNWTTRCATGELSEINKMMIAVFNENITYKTGSKYIKVINKGGGVWDLLSTLITIRSSKRVTF